MPEGARKWLERARLAVNVAATIHVGALGFFAIGWTFFAMLFAGDPQGVMIFLGALALFVGLPGLTVVFFHRARRKRLYLLAGTLLLLITAIAPSLLLIFSVDSSGEANVRLRNVTIITVIVWLAAFGATVITWSKIVTANKAGS